MTIYMESDMYGVVITMEKGANETQENITSYFKGKRMKEVARHKENHMQRHSHAKTNNDEQVRKVQE